MCVGGFVVVAAGGERRAAAGGGGISLEIISSPVAVDLPFVPRGDDVGSIRLSRWILK